MSDREQEIAFDADVSEPKRLTELLLERWYGPRCVEADEHCECCKKWRQFDELFDNPFKESK